MTPRAGAFGNYFFSKIKSNVSKTEVKVGGVYNGKCKLIEQNRNFMTEKDVIHCLSELNNKKCEGFDRIPVCMLYDARVTILPPLEHELMSHGTVTSVVGLLLIIY